MSLSWVTSKFQDLSSSELYEILRLRQEVFVLEQNCAYVDCDRKDFYSYHVMGQLSGSLVAYARIVFPGISFEEVSIGRVVTSPSFRKKGFGKILMHETLRQIEKIYGKVPIRIGAQTYLLGFYKEFGFEPLDEFMEDGIHHTYMIRPA